MMRELVECISRQLQLEFLWSRGSRLAGQVQPTALAGTHAYGGLSLSIDIPTPLHLRAVQSH